MGPQKLLALLCICGSCAPAASAVAAPPSASVHPASLGLPAGRVAALQGFEAWLSGSSLLCLSVLGGSGVLLGLTLAQFG
eukprot:8123580-Lingulodinium_polyedra.AAC.1